MVPVERMETEEALVCQYVFWEELLEGLLLGNSCVPGYEEGTAGTGL
jgi:hypothetical protein